MTNKPNILQPRAHGIRGIFTPLGSQAGGIMSGLLFDLWILVTLSVLMMTALHADNPNWLKEQKVQIVASVSRSLGDYFKPAVKSDQQDLPQAGNIVDQRFAELEAQSK
jgi:hypothetical protein